MKIAQRVLITGSSQGIGLAVARKFLEAQARVCLNAERPLAECPEVQVLLQRYPNQAYYIPMDLMEPNGPEELLKATWDVFAGLDVLINNVGTFREPPLMELTRTHFDQIFGLNVWTALALTQGYVRRAKTHGGRIVFSSSLNGTRSEPGHTLYDASKGALNALVRQLAIELAPLGFTTAGVAPGLIETPLTDFGLQSDPAARTAIEEQIPLRRIGTVEDVASWYVFLASDAARYATGIVIPVDGGLDAQQMPQRPLTEAERHTG